MSIKPIEGSNDFFELAREMKYANKQIDKLRRELAQLRRITTRFFALLRAGYKLVRHSRRHAGRRSGRPVPARPLPAKLAPSCRELM